MALKGDLVCHVGQVLNELGLDTFDQKWKITELVRNKVVAWVEEPHSVRLVPPGGSKRSQDSLNNA